MREVLEKRSGAILFKPEEETEELQKEVESLKKLVAKLEKRVKALESK